MYLILQQEKPEDYVVATGVTTSVRDFIRMAFAYVGISIEFKGEGINETGVVSSVNINRLNLLEISSSVKEGQEILAVDPRYFRPTEVDLLIGDPSKAKNQLGWEPKYDLKGLVDDMMRSDLKLIKKDKYMRDGGYQTMNYFE